MSVITEVQAVRPETGARALLLRIWIMANWLDGMNGFALSVGKDHGADLSTALKDSEDHGLIGTAGLGDPASADVFVHVAGFAADKALVGFDLAPATAQFHHGAVLHCLTNPVEHKPCGLLGDTQGPGDLTRTDTILSSSNEPDGGKPLLKRQRRILEYGSDLSGKLPPGMRALALPFSLSLQESHVSAATSGADNSIRPTMRNHVGKAVIGIRKVDDGLLKSARRFHDVARI
jgi:hypothetical protein